MNGKILFPLLCGLASCLCLKTHALNHETQPPLRIQTSEAIQENADAYFDATLYERAIPLYENLLKTEDLDPASRAHHRLKLAQSYYLTHQYEKVIELLKGWKWSLLNANQRVHALEWETLFLRGLAENKLKRFEDSAVTLACCLVSDPPLFASCRDECALELGIAYFYQEAYDSAREQFQRIPFRSTPAKIYATAQFYLARIAIKERDYNRAAMIGEALKRNPHKDETLPLIVNFLNGEISFAQQDWTTAAAYFEQALPEADPVAWNGAEETLRYLGQSYLHLSAAPGLNRTQTIAFLEKSEACFEKLTATFPSDGAYLALAECYLTQQRLVQDSQAAEKFDRLLQHQTALRSPAARHQGLLLRTQASVSYKERKKLFRELIHPTHKGDANYSLSWYLHGINELEEGQAKKLAGEEVEACKHFETASEAFGKCFNLTYPADPEWAAEILKRQIEAFYFMSTREGYLKALSLVGKMLHAHRDDLFSRLADPSEIYYLQGLIAIKLSEGETDGPFCETVESALSCLIESYPNAQLYGDALHLLGSYYFLRGEYSKALRTLEPLALAFPPSRHRAEALFWMAASAEQLGPNKDNAKKWRRQIVEEHPDSPYAAEAMFRLYALDEYMCSASEPLHHLQTFIHRYPRHPFVLNALLIIGLKEIKGDLKSQDAAGKEKRLLRAIDLFSQLQSTFDMLFENGLLPKERLEEGIRTVHAASMEKSLALLELAQIQNGKSRETALQEASLQLEQLHSAFQDLEHPFRSIFISNPSYRALQDDTAYQLAKCYHLQGKIQEAQKLLLEQVEQCRQMHISRGCHLSKVYRELGKLALAEKKPSLALDRLIESENAAKGKILRVDELLEIWLQQAACYRELGETEEAMLILSRVINYNAISPKRLEAMYLRAAIYEDQERPELAKKQLEALAAKGGHWAQKAKEKLGHEYGQR